MKPRIAIPVPHSTDLEYSQRSWPAYATAVERAGGESVKIPLDLTPRETADLINTCQGVLLPGSGADVNPQKYGQEPIPECAAADPAREAVDELLLQDAHNLYKPLLCICFGTQSLNVWRGGTLLQDLSILPVNHRAGRSVAIAHNAAIAPGSLLGTMVDPAEAPEQDGFLRLPINSSHHQALGIAGDGLRVSARCPQDAVIEAVEGGQATEGATAHFVLGLQWHPERSYEISATSRAIFDRLVTEAKAWIPRPIHTSVATSVAASVASGAE
jgi:putative glutamine amidotransferase